MTDDEFEDVRESVQYHREHGGYSAHNPPGARFCRCSFCRLVRTFDALTDAGMLTGRVIGTASVRLADEEWTAFAAALDIDPGDAAQAGAMKWPWTR